MFKAICPEIFDHINKQQPVIHNISNIVTANDCANITLACGGSPTMADDPEEVEEITAACQGCVINMGNIGGFYQETMLRTGQKNNQVHHPIILDPVGAGAATRRNQVLKFLLKNIQFSLIRGNSSEIRFIGDESSSANGVDASAEDLIQEDNLNSMVNYFKSISRQTGSIIVASGPIDIVANSETAYAVRNGHPMMAKVTGTGCMLSSVLGVFIAANPTHMLEAAAIAVSAYGYAGELAYQRIEQENKGSGSLRTYLIDYMSKMDVSLFQKGAKITQI